MDLMYGESFREVVYFDGEVYLLDMRYTFDAGSECMAFRCDFDGNVLSSEDVWVKHGMPLTQKEMNKCCSEFIHYMKRLKQHRIKNRTFKKKRSLKSHMDSLPEADFDWYGCLPYAGPDDD